MIASPRLAPLPAPHALWKAVGTYLVATLAANLVWETLQLPLYTLWTSASPPQQAFAVLHCSGGDLLITMSCLAVSLLVVGRAQWPRGRRIPVALLTIAIGLAYTVFSEWLNVSLRGSWAYSALMPVLPLGFFPVGLSPLLQWVVVPAIGFEVVRRQTRQLPPAAL